MNDHHEAAVHLLNEVTRHPAKLDPDQATMAHAILALVPQPTVVNVTAADSEAALKRLMDLRKWSNQ